MGGKTLNEVINMIKICESYMNDESINIIKMFVSGLYNVDIEKLT